MKFIRLQNQLVHLGVSLLAQVEVVFLCFIVRKINKKNFFVEIAKVFGFYYGTPIANINKAFKKGKHI